MRIKGKNINVLNSGLLFFVIIFCSISAFAQTTIVPPVTPDRSIPVPNLDVSHFSGSAGGTIPIVVPPGRNGIEPDLALTYNLSQKNGWLGAGWDMDVGSIQRSTKRGVDYTKNDFVVNTNGSSFELVQRTDWGSGYYGAKIENSFTKYYFTGSKWIVTTKEGIKYFYGQDWASRQENGTNIFKWCLDRVEDSNGNYMTFSYYESSGEIYLEYIRYTGNTKGLSPTNLVKFHSVSRTDAQTNYTPGFEVKTLYRIWAIEITANGAPVRTYWLQYNTTGVPSVSRLTSVTQYGSDFDVRASTHDVTGHHLPAIALTYKDTETNAFTRFHDPSGIGTMSWEHGVYTRHLAGDFNGDGITDILKWETQGGENYLYLGKAEGTFQQIYQPTGIGAMRWGYGTEAHHLTGDFNGDGRGDIVVLENMGGENYLFLGKANGTFQKIYQPAGIGPIGWDTGTRIGLHISGDFNGDGRTDILFSRIKLQTPVWRCSGYPDEESSDKMGA